MRAFLPTARTPLMSDQAETWFGLPRRAKPLVQAGILLGLGLGGFFDGIVLHQILRWHHMASAVTDTTTVSGLRLNVLLDGLFHAVTYIFTVVGIVLLWRAWRTPNVPSRAGHCSGRPSSAGGCSTSSRRSLTTTCWASTTSSPTAPVPSSCGTSRSSRGACCSSSAATPSFAAMTP